MKYPTVSAALRKGFWPALLALIGLLVACGDGVIGEGQSDGDLGTTSAELAGDKAAGSIPSGLPARLTVGLFEDGGQTWMKNSAAKWDVRYRYFTKGWVNNWGFSAYDGSWGLSYFRECDTQGYVPAVQYYQMNGEAGGGESAFLSKTQNATTMRSYFGDFKILMQRVKDFGKPVMILLEADGYGFLQQQTSSNPNASAAVASTGMAELAGLPNTVAGWGMAFLAIKKAVGANNAVLGIHLSGWASGKDLFHSSVTDALQPEVDKVYNFLAPFGIAANATGITYDVLVGDPLDRDADFYKLTLNQDRWWDASDTASISSKSFNRYAEWLRLWNQKSAKRWVLWQIPLGNSNHRNVNNDGTARAGYKDNRPEYFFGTGSDVHRVKFADAGVISLLFGAGAGGVSSYQNDQYTDGQLFMKSRAGAFLNAGGLAISSGGGGGGTGGTGGTAGTGGTSGSGGTAGTGGTGGTGGSSCSVTYEAESMTHETGGAVTGGWNIWSNGGISKTHSFVAGAATVSVVAQGSVSAGVWPHMVVTIDGVQIGQANVSSTSYQTYSFSTTIAAAGTKTLRIAFDNDLNANGEDRNLIVDKATVAQGCSTTGSILREVWTGITGTAVSLIPVTTTPNSTSSLTLFEAPTNWSDNYGQRIRGTITAPTTGSYTFWIAGDDSVELWLSTSSSSSNKVRIAFHTSWTNSREWGKISTQKSAAISLTAGSRYYIEALMKEGGGGDNLAVGWAKPGQSTSAPSEVIPGSVLSPP